MNTSGPAAHWAVPIEKNLSDHTYGTRIDLIESDNEADAHAALDAILAGRRSELVSISADTRIREFGPGQFGVLVEHRLPRPPN